MMGSSEAGPWAISNPHLTGEEETLLNDNSGTADFVFDTRNMHIEILPETVLEGGSSSLLPLGLRLQGIIVQTSLQRLRNPLVRYITDDIGSLHLLPDSDCVRALIPDPDARQHLRVLRMQGRDRRFSFKWSGSYIEFENLRALLQAPEYAILQWQVILDQLESLPQKTLEVRLLQGRFLAREELVKHLRKFFVVDSENEQLFRVVFVDDLGGFERSKTAGKVISFIDRQIAS